MKTGMIKCHVILLAILGLAPEAALAKSWPATVGRATAKEDRAAIGKLLATYTRAVSTRDEALFETILLGRDIPFSYVGPTMPAGTSASSTRDFESFRRSVFEGEPFVQTFDHVHVHTDDALAQVSLIFRNVSPKHRSWGFKTLHLLRVAGSWKIASEFFTAHAETGPARGKGQ